MFGSAEHSGGFSITEVGTEAEDKDMARVSSVEVCT
jgi:hypothetical protein